VTATDCQNPHCTRMGWNGNTDRLPQCVGYHCSSCGLPCSSHGHRCDLAIDTAWREHFGKTWLGLRPDP
jgi:hypothetical protein